MEVVLYSYWGSPVQIAQPDIHIPIPNTGAPHDTLPSKTPRHGPICGVSRANIDMTRKTTEHSPAAPSNGGPTQTWKISVTPAQRARITLAAKRANMPIGAFIHDRAVNGQAQARRDWAIGAQRLDAAATCLATLAAELTHHAAPRDAVTILAALVGLERTFERIARPWLCSPRTGDMSDDVSDDTSDDPFDDTHTTAAPASGVTPC